MWHGMAVTVGGSVLAFGRNHKGQLGTGDKDNRWQPVTISLAWDDTDPDYFRAAQVACGMSHSMVLVAHKGRLTACTTGGVLPAQLPHALCCPQTSRWC
jgi:alpha-tubulin suppressor-like RCC1 family protein